MILISVEITQERGASKLPDVLARRRPGPAVIGFAVAFAGVLLVGLLQGTRPFYGDSSEYWSLARVFTKPGHFSLLNFESPLRGYALPLTIYGLQAIGDAVQWSQASMAMIFNVLLYALIGAVLAPRLAEIAWPEHRWGLWRRLALTALLVIFWSGDINYPLADFPGLTMVLVALVAIARVDTPGWMLIAGIAGGLAVNMRPADLTLLPMLLVIVALSWFDQRGAPHPSLARRALCVGLLVVGFLVASLPQSLSAHRYYNTWSFIPGASTDLEKTKLAEGMVNQRWDTYEGPEGPSAIAYGDETGQRLLAQQPEGKIETPSQYIGVIVSHPDVMIPLLARHIINGMDARYNTIYVEHRDSEGRLWLRLAGFLLVFLALVRVLWPSARRRLSPARWRYPVALLLCCLTSVPTEMETRYMLPAYLLSYMLVLAPGWPNPIGPPEAGLRRFRTSAILAAAYLVFMAVVWHVVSGVHGHVVFG
ncbi:MAG TPA: hypothetical protein VGH60_10630 [Solirubrobacteraceae bacterium]